MKEWLLENKKDRGTEESQATDSDRQYAKSWTVKLAVLLCYTKR